METRESLLEKGFSPIDFIESTLIPNSPALFLYYIDRNGIVYSIRSKRYLKAGKHSLGYLQYYLTDFLGGGKWYKAHRLVCLQFIPNPNNLSDVNHKNGIKSDNRVENLEWVSHSDNIKHSYDKLGRVHDGSYLSKRIKCSNGKIYNSAREAASDTGCKTSNISMCCNGKVKQTKGFKFSFENTNDTDKKCLPYK